MTDKERNVYLIGPMGAGKTAVGRELARALGKPFLDSDAEIEKRTGVDIPFIFEKEGEERFRAREREVIADLSALDGIVLATGGGAVLDPANRERLAATGVVVYLRTTVAEQLRRTRTTRHRPLLTTEDPASVLERLAAARGHLYEEVADLCVDTTGRQVRAVVAAVRQLLERRSAAALQK